MTKKIVVQLGRKKHKGMTVIHQPSGNVVVKPRSKKQLEADQKARERLLADDRFVKGAPTDGHKSFNEEGHNQHTSPRGHKLISDATNAYINDAAPDNLCLAVQLPSGSTFADVIARQQLMQAASGRLDSTQFAMDVTEDKMKGPGGSNSAPVIFNPIAFVEPKKNG